MPPKRTGYHGGAPAEPGALGTAEALPEMVDVRVVSAQLPKSAGSGNTYVVFSTGMPKELPPEFDPPRKHKPHWQCKTRGKSADGSCVQWNDAFHGVKAKGTVMKFQVNQGDGKNIRADAVLGAAELQMTDICSKVGKVLDTNPGVGFGSDGMLRVRVLAKGGAIEGAPGSPGARVQGSMAKATADSVASEKARQDFVASADEQEKKELEEAKKQSRQEWEAELAKAEAERDADYEKEVLAGTAGDSELGRRRKQREQLDVFKQTKMMATMAKLQQTKADFGEHMTQERELDDAVEQAKKAEEAKKKAEAEAKRLAEEAKQKQEKQAAARKAQEDSETAARDLVVKDEEKDRGIYQLKAMKAKSLITVTQEKADAITHLADLEEQRLEAQDKVEKLGHETRSKHNELEDLKGKIRVYVRTRPMKKGEAGGALEFPGGDMRSILLREGEGLRQKTYDYLFDRAFPGDTSQEEVFNETKGMCQSAMDGYNCCIFAYGQTGSGKTHTLVGTVDDPGIARRSMRHFFDLGAKLPPGQKLHMECSMMELYIDTFFDLLGKARAPLQVKQGAGGNFEMEGRTWADAPTYEALVALFAKGEGARSVRATSMNERSSRSHLIFTIRTKTKEGDATIRDGMFALVDLAGSERIKKSEVAAEGLREAVAINKSLSALGNVIEALSKVSRHIPYRDHQLTQAMQPFLKGNAKMLMFLAVSPASSSFQESKGSLTFAQRTKQVQLSNQEALKEVRAEIKIKEGELDSMMKDLHENARIAGESEIEAEDTRDQIEQFDDMIKDLYEELEQLQQDYPGY